MNSYSCCKESTLEGNKILSQLNLLKMLADKNRLKILCLLNLNTHNVREIIEHLDESQSLISHHLISLKEIGLVSFQKKGREIYYSLSAKGVSVIKLLQILSRNDL